MTDQSPAPEKLQFVENVGLFFERSGLTRMAGRMLGWLLVCDPAHQSQGDLVDALQASKGSISSTVRFLVRIGMVEQISLPGERRDYYRLMPDAWGHVMQQKMREVTAFRELAEQGLAVLDGEPPAQRERLQDMRDIYAFMERALPRLIAEWQQEHAQEHSESDGAQRDV